MELKFENIKTFDDCIILLIEPYGIEIREQQVAASLHRGF